MARLVEPAAKLATARPVSPETASHSLGTVPGRRRLAKPFTLTLTDPAFSFARQQAKIDAEAARDGFYLLHTSAPAASVDATATIVAAKSRPRLEQAFRCPKSEDLEVRSIHPRLPGRGRGSVFLCTLAQDVQRPMHQKLVPLSFHDHDRPAAAAARTSAVAKADVSPTANANASSRTTADGLPPPISRTLTSPRSPATPCASPMPCR